ncbi:hypothetical protein PILCRDRAFT_80244 [Piloderma croceum F 1598]|uniref:non-specific serine/threonine protein kinase n=1 Tax=Piloderma croceum (strain F 1598) TaxID=765440 RepID=A0A0C3F2W3_PILCF|nr:hypothetical protein PILCRDRAFT_80244 [Piloderma croceum F 1598]
MATYSIGQRLGSGSYSIVYEGKNSRGNAVAVKKSRVTTSVAHTLLRHEACALVLLTPHKGFPRAHAWGRSQWFEYLAMDLLGPSLSDMLRMQGGQFNVGGVLLLTIQMARSLIDMLEHLHSRHIVHCDIKPNNLLFGNSRDGSTAGQLHLVDFGFARYYRDPVSKVLRPCLNGQKMIGTRYYSSVNILHGISPSPRDDLESLAYTILSILRCNAPWDDCTERREKAMKTAITGAVLFSGLPREFGELFDHARELRYDQQPNYQLLKGIFRSRACAIGVQLDEPFNNHSTGMESIGDELVAPSWPLVEQFTGFNDAGEEEEDDDCGVGPDWDGYISVTSWLLQDGVPEQDLFGEETKMLEEKVDPIAKPPDMPKNDWMFAVEEVIIM